MPSSAQKARGQQATVSLAKAKATLSAVVDRVERDRSPITILRRGMPVAQIIPLSNTPPPSMLGSMAGTGRELGDIVSSYLEEWTAGDA